MSDADSGGVGCYDDDGGVAADVAGDGVDGPC